MRIRQLLVVVTLCAAAPLAAAEDRPAGPAPSFAMRGASVGDADASGATLIFEAELANSTAGGISLGGLAWALELDGKRILEGAVPGGAELAPGQAMTVAFPGRVRYGDLPGLAAKTVIGRRIPFRLQATADVRTPDGPLSIPIVYDGELSAPKRPEVGLHKLRIVSMNPFDAAVEVQVALENDNTFGWPAGSLRYRITIAGGDVSTAEVALPAVAPRGKAIVAIPLKLSLRKLGSGVVKALKGDSALVGLHAVASLGPMAWPVDLETRLPTIR